MVNLSEALSRVPGLVVSNRNNYAQDLQINSRGFGARSSFGVRGLRLVADGIPASGPDGQGQVSNFDLAGAERIEVLRGPFSALYGNSSGGVISLVSASPKSRELSLGLDRGSDGLQQWRVGIAAPLAGGFSLRAQLSKFETDGLRPQSSAERTLGNVRLGWDGAHDRVVVILNSINQPALDPLGLTRDQFDGRPRPDHRRRAAAGTAGAGRALQHAQEYLAGPGRRELAPPLRRQRRAARKPARRVCRQTLGDPVAIDPGHRADRVEQPRRRDRLRSSLPGPRRAAAVALGAGRRARPENCCRRQPRHQPRGPARLPEFHRQRHAARSRRDRRAAPRRDSTAVDGQDRLRAGRGRPGARLVGDAGGAPRARRLQLGRPLYRRRQRRRLGQRWLTATPTRWRRCNGARAAS